MATTDLHFVCGALRPTKRGIRFLGGAVDDGVQVDAAAAAMANVSTYGTITAWFMVPDNTGTYCIFGAGDANVVEFISLTVEAGTIQVACTDNTTAQWDYNTAAGTVTPHQWHHVALVQDAHKPKVYIDGVEKTLTETTGTTPASWFKACAGIDGAHIGAAEEGGDAGLTKEFKGYISHVKIWAGTTSASALSASQVLQDYRGDSVGTRHNDWTLDQSLSDTGSGADNGTAVGDIIYSDGNEFSSRLTFLETVPLAADNVSIMCDQGVGYAYSILAA